jgi:hypothetical protein
VARRSFATAFLSHPERRRVAAFDPELMVLRDSPSRASATSQHELGRAAGGVNNARFFADFSCHVSKFPTTLIKK